MGTFLCDAYLFATDEDGALEVGGGPFDDFDGRIDNVALVSLWPDEVLFNGVTTDLAAARFRWSVRRDERGAYMKSAVIVPFLLLL